jgi:hypothetical protein
MGDLHARLDLNHRAIRAVQDQNGDAHRLSGGFYLSAVARVQDKSLGVTSGSKDSMFFESNSAVAIAGHKFNHLGDFSSSIGKDCRRFRDVLCGEGIGDLAAHAVHSVALARTLVWRRGGSWILSVLARFVIFPSPILAIGTIRFWVMGGVNQGLMFKDMANYISWHYVCVSSA